MSTTGRGGNLANVYKDEGRYAEAEPLDLRSLAIYKKALGPEHREVGRALNNLGLLHENAGRYADAEPIFKQALAIREKALGPDHPEVANTLNNLASLYDRLQRYQDAEPLFRRALEIDQKALSPDHPEVAHLQNNLAEIYREMKRFSDAEPLYKQSLALREKALGPDHPGTAKSINNLAWLYLDQARYADALPLIERLIASGGAQTKVALPVLFGAERAKLIAKVALLKLDADWIVLSACNTIAGNKPGAEALSGLARAFFYAGARALLVTHWSVASDSATRLTTATFEILKADPTLGRAEALRRAMLVTSPTPRRRATLTLQSGDRSRLSAKALCTEAIKRSAAPLPQYQW